MSLSGTATQWTILNPVLAVGEIGYETDTGKTKKGDGVTPWASLAYDGTTYPKGAPVTDANGNSKSVKYIQIQCDEKTVNMQAGSGTTKN